jgi:hypothetical protein
MQVASYLSRFALTAERYRVEAMSDQSKRSITSASSSASKLIRQFSERVFALFQRQT